MYYANLSKLIILILLICPFTSVAQSISACQESDYQALRALYLSTDGDNWITNTNWPNEATFLANPTMPLGTNIDLWYGVTVDVDAILTKLIISAKNIDGILPPEMGLFCRIEELNLRNNQLSGAIPIELWDLTTLTKLDFGTNNGFNELTGTLPTQIGQLTNLTHLNLGNNEFMGPIPSQIGFLSNLTYLHLGGNTGYNEFSGALPSTFCNLTSLTYLDLGNNLFTGSIPACIGGFTGLVHLNMAGNPNTNDFSGPIPDLSGLVNLVNLYLQNNSLTGPMPPYLASLPDLIRLLLLNNQLSGCYDPALSGLCSQLLPNYNMNIDISFGNSFDAPWEDFCANMDGACCPSPDTTQPIVSCVGGTFIEYVNDGFCTSAVVNFQAAAEASMMPTDDCGISSVVCFPSSGSSFGIGQSTVQCNAIDLSGNMSQTCTFIVEVLPTQIYASITTVVDETCPGQADGSIDVYTIGDLYPLAYLWSNGAVSEDISGLSPGTYTLTVSDANGCTETISATVGGTPDTTPPSVTCQGQTFFEYVNTGNCDAAVVNFQADAEAYMNATDNCGVASIVCSAPSGSTFPVGTSVVFCEAIDFSGNMSQTCTFTVEVLPSSLYVSTLAVVDETCPGQANGSIDIWSGGGVAPLSYLWSNGAITEDISGLGPGSYTLTVTDALACTSTITVVIVSTPDNTPPVVSCTGPLFYEYADPSNCNQAAVNFQADVEASMMPTDDCGLSTVVCFPSSGSTFGVGQSTVQCNAIDMSGNWSQTCTFTIEVLACPCPNVLTINGSAADGIHQANTSINSNAVLNASQDVHYKAGQIIELNPGFTVPTQTDFHAEIESCF